MKKPLQNPLFVLLVPVGLCFALVALGDINSTHHPGAGVTDPDTLVVVITPSSTQFNDIEVQCKSTDTNVNDFGIDSGWNSPGSFHSENGNKYIRFTRSTTDNSDITLKITGPHGRGKEGSIHITKDGNNVGSTSDNAFISADAPGLGPVGIGILIALLLAGGAFVLVRGRKSAATT